MLSLDRPSRYGTPVMLVAYLQQPLPKLRNEFDWTATSSEL